jgi:hypothetical protein
MSTSEDPEHVRLSKAASLFLLVDASNPSMVKKMCQAEKQLHDDDDNNDDGREETGKETSSKSEHGKDGDSNDKEKVHSKNDDKPTSVDNKEKSPATTTTTTYAADTIKKSSTMPTDTDQTEPKKSTTTVDKQLGESPFPYYASYYPPPYPPMGKYNPNNNSNISVHHNQQHLQSDVTKLGAAAGIDRFHQQALQHNIYIVDNPGPSDVLLGKGKFFRKFIT